MAIYGHCSRRRLRTRPRLTLAAAALMPSTPPPSPESSVSDECQAQVPQALVLDRDRLQFEMAAPQDSRSANKLARRVFLRKVGLIDWIELVEERQVGTGNLHVNEIVHRHTGLRQNVFLTVKQQLYLVLNFLGGPSVFVEPDSACQVKSIPRQNGIAEWSRDCFARQVDRLARALRHRM